LFYTLSIQNQSLAIKKSVVQEFLKRGRHRGGNFDQPNDYPHFEERVITEIIGFTAHLLEEIE
jgi:hypothetical protein